MKYNNFIEILNNRTEELNNGIGSTTTLLPLDERSRNNMDKFCEKDDIDELQSIVGGLTDVDYEIDALMEYDGIQTALVYKDDRKHKINMYIEKIQDEYDEGKLIRTTINEDNASNIGYNYILWNNNGNPKYDLVSVIFTLDMTSIERFLRSEPNKATLFITTINGTKYCVNLETKEDFDLRKVSSEEENFYANIQNLKIDMNYTDLCYLLKLSAPKLFNSLDKIDIKILNSNNTDLGEAIYSPKESIDVPVKFIRRNSK